MAGMPGMSLNHLLPRPTKSGVIGPPKLKMPQGGGDSMPRMGNSILKSSLGPELQPLPTHPFQSTQGMTPSLLQTKSPRHRKHGSRSGGLDGIS